MGLASLKQREVTGGSPMTKWRTLTRIGAVALAAAMAVMLASVFSSAPRVQAVPTTVITYSPDVCTILLAGTASEDVASSVPQFAGACQFPNNVGGLGQTFLYGGIFPPNLDIVAAAASQRNGNNDTFAIPNPDFTSCNDDPAADDLSELMCSLDERDGTIDAAFTVVPEDFAGIGLEANQIHDSDGQMVVVAFVDDDAPVFLEVEADGAEYDESNGSGLVCSGVNSPPQSIFDADCDGVPPEGDGAVAGFVVAGAGGIERGDGLVSAQQEGVILFAPIIVVGEPGVVNFQVLTEATIEPSIQTGLDDDECPLPGAAAEFIEELGKPEKTILVARVADNDETNVTGALVKWTVSDPDIAIVAAPLTPTIDLGGFGIGAPNILCGTMDPGTVTITAELLDSDGQAAEAGTVLDPLSGSDTTELDFPVMGPPANLTLAVAPAAIECNGTNTASVTATVTDAEGNPVVDGNEVTFNVQVLGTANPIIAETAAGVATSTITPLATTEGVPVVVTVGDVQGSTLVNCSPTAGPGTPPPPPGNGGGPGGQPGGVVRPPDTGTGGDLDGRGSLDIWMAVALFAGAMGLVGARLALRRVA
jgi:hypothetical protein